MPYRTQDPQPPCGAPGADCFMGLGITYQLKTYTSDLRFRLTEHFFSGADRSQNHVMRGFHMGLTTWLSGSSSNSVSLTAYRTLRCKQTLIMWTRVKRVPYTPDKIHDKLHYKRMSKVPSDARPKTMNIKPIKDSPGPIPSPIYYAVFQ